MQIIQTSLLFLLVVPTVSGALDGFDKQVEAARISSELVQEPHLRGSTDEEDTLVAVDRTTRNNGRRKNEWLDAHNAEREEQHVNAGYEYNPMKWSFDLASGAESWANELVRKCRSKIPDEDSGIIDYGWNIAGKQGMTEFRTVEDVFKLWNNKMYKGYPKNREISQVLWRATEYVGCADAAADKNDDGVDKSCTFSVCVYAKPGNCGMGDIKNWEDTEDKIMTSRACGPCPDDHPNCKSGKPTPLLVVRS